MRLSSALLLLLSSTLPVLSIKVTYPNGDLQQNWVGLRRSQEVKWLQPLDIQSFDIVLTRQQPPYFKIIDTDVNAQVPSGETWVYPPDEKWPEGEHFRVNLVKVHEPETIYAQSNEFSIKSH